MTPRWWAEPTAGDIVWCHFPDDIQPRPKPRPALILAVFDDDAPQFTVRVAYGTSQRTTTLHRGEFSILRERNPAAYESAGLSYDTKFDLRQSVDLPIHDRVVLGAAGRAAWTDAEAGHPASLAGTCRPGRVFSGSRGLSRRRAQDKARRFTPIDSALGPSRTAVSVGSR